jgi:hypothetical protein
MFIETFFNRKGKGAALSSVSKNLQQKFSEFYSAKLRLGHLLALRGVPFAQHRAKTCSEFAQRPLQHLHSASNSSRAGRAASVSTPPSKQGQLEYHN